MGRLTGKQCELLYCNTQAGNVVLANGLFPTNSLMGGLPPCVIPAGFWNVGTSLKLLVRGRTTWASGLLGLSVWFIDTPIFPGTTNLTNPLTFNSIGLSANAPAFVASGTGVPWVLEADITMRSVGVGASSVLCVMGEIRAPLMYLTPFNAPLPSSGTSILLTTYDVDKDWYLHPACVTTATSVNIEIMKVWGEN